MPLAGLDLYQIAPSLTGEMLRPLIEGSGDIRMHVSNGALGQLRRHAAAAAPVRPAPVPRPVR